MKSGTKRLDLETSLLRIVVGYRVFGAVWLAVLAAITLFGSSDVERPGVVTGALVLATAWTAGVVLASFRRPAVLRTMTFVIADTVVASVILLAPLIAGTGGFAGGYPLAAVFHGVYATGWLGGMTAAGALTAVSIWRVVNFEFSDLTAATATVVSFLFTAAATAWAIETMRGREALRLEAEEALAAEQTQRLRAEERAALATEIHDSVLQTLSLIQRDHDDAARVASLARRQERELREVLYGAGKTIEGGFRAAITKVCAEVEALADTHVEVIIVGDRSSDHLVEACALATREAVVNAAKHAGVDHVSVYGEANDKGLAVYVRDRGRGFDPETVPHDRRGITESIVARVTAVGGEVDIRSADGSGTEVRIVIGAGT